MIHAKHTGDCMANPDATPEQQAGRAGGWVPSRQRAEGLRRGRAVRLGGAGETPSHAAVRSAEPAMAALAENVRDYAIFLLDRRGIILFWGTGAHLMKWWTSEEAEGGHLSMLYPDGGSEDGTAYEHLLESAKLGEYAGEGQRIRRDGSAFWAGVTLTALRDGGGKLFGFAKVTRDLTASRAREAMLAGANSMQVARDVALELVRTEQAARAEAEETAEFAVAHLRGAREYIAQVLEPELEAEREQYAELRAQVDSGTARREGEAREAPPRRGGADHFGEGR